ncbi:DUF4837 family protein [Sinomicrobium kalidii]|uniref:DUF4837 family protein n=1 Tax=Sinomicrobium kalidii TaxID=2900738 RepID=UPI001E33D44D|nr:DUF4837 family protein [Sinomicrobium kalidii]UGU18041.1 DUF4837 family protein [Sinomicrobium kalidii]
MVQNAPVRSRTERTWDNYGKINRRNGINSGIRKGIALFLTGVLLVLSSCKESEKDKKRYLPDSVGAINSLAVVIDNEMWKGEVGDEIRNYYAAPVDGLPSVEPLFTLHQIPPSVFNGSTTKSRNILLVQKDTTTGSGIKTDTFARPQKIGVVKAPDNGELIALIAKTSDKYIREFKDNDVKENQKRFLTSENKETYLQQKFGIALTMPSVYKTAKQEDNFIWIERMISKGTMNVFVYELPLNSIPDDSTRVDAFIKMHDSIGKKYVPGREKGMYMITQKAYAPYIFDITLAGKPTMETKGMWEMKNFAMAGPFINYIITDKENDRLLVLEGLTFAPSEDKRDYMFELESILKSIRFTGK